MKKQFFYAAMAVALMASCTSEDNLAVDPVNPTPDSESRAGISLGIASPTVNADLGRSMGSVGDVESGNNVWNGEKLYVAMYEKGTNTLATDPELVTESNATGIIMSPETHDFYAPKADKATAADSIRIYQKTGTSIIDYLYYPVSGKFDFVGYHVDDLTVNFDETTRVVSNIVITGQQDIMGAITRELDINKDNKASLSEGEFNALKNDWAFSARTARNKIHPTLQFKHQLARLKFFVRAGSDTTALFLKKTASDGTVSWEERQPQVTGQATSTGAMYITGITAKSLVNNLTMNLAGTDSDGKTCVTTEVADANSTGDFELKTRGTDGSIITGDMTPVAPKYPVSLKKAEESNTSGNKTYEETPVGESIMFFPYGESETEIDLDVVLSQYVVDYENETTGELEWASKSYTAPVTVKSTSIKNGVGQTSQKFEAGNSYNIYITVYSFERIVVSAELTAWADGGDVDVDVEEDATQDESTATYTTTIAVVYDDQATGVTPVVKINGTETATFSGTTGAEFTYEVSATGYQTATGTAQIGDANATETITLKKLYEGTIKINGLAEGTTVSKFELDSTEISAETDGSYKFQGVDGGSYSYKVTLSDDSTKEGTITYAKDTTEYTIN